MSGALEIAGTGPFREAFAATLAGPCAAEPGWLRDLRQAAFDAFARIGPPGKRLESWRYTAPRLQKWLVPALGADNAQAVARSEAIADGIVWYDLRSALADDPDRLRDLWQADIEAVVAAGDQPLALLNAAFATQVTLVTASPGAICPAPREFGFFGAGQSRLLVDLEAGASLALFGHYGLKVPGWAHIGAAIRIGKGAHMRRLRLQEDSRGAITQTTNVSLAEDARFSQTTLAFGAEAARDDVRVRIDGKGAAVSLTGVGLVGPGNHQDMTTVVDHRVGGASSNQKFRNIVAAKGRALYQGKVIVRPDAQATEADQESRNLLLDAKAEAITKPELEIFADDVKCTHGATVGELDADQLFYLAARGIGEDEARAMLVTAFYEELLADVEPPDLHRRLQQAAAGFLSGRQSAERATG